MSCLGSPNIFLKKNFDRGHYYKGYYIIRNSSKENFENYLPVNHLKISNKCQKQLIEGLAVLIRVNSSDDDDCGEFVTWLWEYRSTIKLDKAHDVLEILKTSFYYKASVYFISLENMISLKNLVKGYIELYQWSKKIDFKAIQHRIHVVPSNVLLI